MQPVFWKRDHSAKLGHNASVSYNVTRMLWHVKGGPDQADIEVHGETNNLWELVGMLRCGVEIWDNVGFCWNGYINEVVIHQRGNDISFSLDRMYNRIAVQYNYTGPGAGDMGISGQTQYTTDTVSTGTYGTKEILLTADRLSAAAAVKWRDAKLAEFSKPTGTPEPAQNEVESATLYCRGWWYTLGWRMASVPYTETVAYTTLSGAGAQAVGHHKLVQKVKQIFTVGATAINVAEVQLYVSKTGTPTDDMQVGIYKVDAETDPIENSVKMQDSIPGDLLSSTAAAWKAFSGEQFTLAANTSYAIVVNRTGKLDAANYYNVGINTGLGYAGGAFEIFAGFAWYARSPDADMLFKINTDDAATIAAQTASLMTSYGQFLTLLNNGMSTESQTSYMPGDVTVLQAIEDFMAVSGANGRRILANVTQYRNINFYEEPAMPAAGLHIVMRGGKVYYALGKNLRSPSGRDILPTDCRFIVGTYVDVQENRIDNGTSYSLMDPQLIESVEWTPDGGVQPRFKGAPAPEDEYEGK